MKSFKDLNIRPSIKKREGEKIKIKKVFNQPIVVNGFEIVDSKYEGKGKCLYLSILLNNEPRLVFTGSVVLMDIVSQMSADDFPFTTTIVEVGERYEFT